MNRGFARQHTIMREVWCGGVALHSGTAVTMRLKPAPVNSGVRFCRVDVAGRPTVPASHHQVVDTLLATSIGFDGVVVSTIEHLMAALVGRGIDNVLVEVDGPEVPIFDGSAAQYLELLDKAGSMEQLAPRRCMRIARPIRFREGDAYINATPSDGFSVHYAIDFPHPLVGRQEFTWSFSEAAFVHEIAKARTFGFLREVQKLLSMGLAQGGSLDNTVVFDEYRLLNHDGLRYTDECVRHKILDFMGDLALAGMPLLGHFEVYKAGHAMHNSFLKQLVTKPESYCVSRVGIPATPYFQPPSIAGIPKHFASATRAL